MLQTRAGRLRGADIGLGGDLHPDVAGCGRKDRTDKKGDRNDPMRVDLSAIHLVDRSGICKQSSGDHGENAEHAPFGLKKCHGTRGNKTGKFLHLRFAGFLFADPGRFKCHYQQAEEAQCGHKVNYVIVHIVFRLALTIAEKGKY